MVKTWSLLFGIGLLVLGLAGLGRGSWLPWFDLAAALGAFIIAGSARPVGSRLSRAGPPFGLALGLFAVWAIAQAAAPPAGWIIGWTFGFACAFLLLGIIVYSSNAPTTTTQQPARQDDVPKKIA